jgi:hypothetical protein
LVKWGGFAGCTAGFFRKYATDGCPAVRIEFDDGHAFLADSSPTFVTFAPLWSIGLLELEAGRADLAAGLVDLELKRAEITYAIDSTKGRTGVEYVRESAPYWWRTCLVVNPDDEIRKDMAIYKEKCQTSNCKRRSIYDSWNLAGMMGWVVVFEAQSIPR